MIVTKMKIINFKKFYKEVIINFNEDINVIIGDNESGKSTILLALDLVLSGSQRKIENIGLENIFNYQVVNEFMSNDKNVANLPEIIIELYLQDTGKLELNGNNNTEKETSDGIYLKIAPDDDFLKIIDESLKAENAVFPFEYYRCTFKTFSDETYNSYKKPVRHIIIDSSNISNEYYMKEYILSLYSSYTDEKSKNLYNNEFRKLKKSFEQNNLSSLNEKISEISFGLTTDNKYSFENNLTIYERGINLINKGSGTQSMLKIKSAINKHSENIDLILIEEPENHLSDLNMKKMLQNIIDSNNKQIFITTHNSFICSRLNLKKTIALSENKIKTTEFNLIDEETASFFVKCPSNTLLNFILSNKVILVEGSAEYILLEKLYQITTKSNVNEDKVNIISVNGLSFKRYLNVAKELGIKVAVITDNDKNYNENITDKYKDFQDNNKIKIFSDNCNERYTFEVCLYNDNQEYIEQHNITSSKDKLNFMLNNKSESAYRILKELERDSANFKIPDYLVEAIIWIRN